MAAVRRRGASGWGGPGPPMCEPRRLDVFRSWLSRTPGLAPSRLREAMVRTHDSVDVKASHGGLFMFSEAQRRDWPCMPAHDFGVERMRTADLWARLEETHARAGSPHLYITGGLDDLCQPGAEELAAWPLAPGTSGESFGPSGPPAEYGLTVRPSLWLATRGAVTVTHYDTLDNVLVQLSGAKEVLLWPPTAARQLQLYPDASPRARKSMADVASPVSTSTMPPPAQVYLLTPGDALFIPAFYFHRCQSTSSASAPGPAPGISLNAFSPSAVATRGAHLLAGCTQSIQPFPVDPCWPVERKAACLATAIGHGRQVAAEALAAHAHASVTFPGALDLVEHVRERYEHLRTNGALPTAPGPARRRRASPPVRSVAESDDAAVAGVTDFLRGTVDMSGEVDALVAAAGPLEGEAAVDYAAGVCALVLCHMLEGLALRCVPHGASALSAIPSTLDEVAVQLGKARVDPVGW